MPEFWDRSAVSQSHSSSGLAYVYNKDTYTIRQLNLSKNVSVDYPVYEYNEEIVVLKHRHCEYAVTEPVVRPAPAPPRGNALAIVSAHAKQSRLFAPLEEASTTNQLTVTATNAEAVRRLWFETKPLTSPRVINGFATLRLVTHCAHQGWVSEPDNGTWSWFEVAILSKNTGAEGERVKKRDVGTPLSWFTHSVPVDTKVRKHLGSLLSANHELFVFLQVGDSIGIFVCAQFPAWQCKGLDGRLTLELVEGAQ